MKKILSIFILIGFIVLNSCDPMEDIYTEIDDAEIPAVGEVEYTLTSDDYAALADLISDLYPDDPAAAFLEANEFFTDAIPVQNYVHFFLNETYPWLGPGSVANITYNYNGDMPEDLNDYVTIDEYDFVAADYKAVDSLVNITGYLFPAFNPDLYLPGVLASAMASASAGDQYLVSYKYSDVTPIINAVANTEVASEDFETATAYDPIDINGWTQFQEAGTAESWEGRSYGGNKYAQFSAYNSGEASNIVWLISPAIDLADFDDVIVNFKSKDGYNNGDPLTVHVSTNYSGTGDPTTADWESLSPTVSTGNSSGYASDWVESGDMSLNDYVGGDVYIAFKYTGGDDGVTTTLQIDDFNVIALTAGFEIIGDDAYTVKEYYEYNGTAWNKMDNVYYLTSKDYDSFGDGPGKYNNFSGSDLPQDYLPKLLDNMYPLAGEDFSVVVVYKYYTGSGTATLADEYTYTSGSWVSSYSYVTEQTAQFAVSATTSQWVFDPTETYTMVSADYQTIVDYVKDTYGDSFLDSYGTQEFYYGAGAYYSNFDLRGGKWNADEFDSWEEAVEEALGTVLLPVLYPNATLQVNGVDMYYRVIFATYSGAAGTYAMKFQVTKAGPNPEFTLVEGPILQ